MNFDNRAIIIGVNLRDLQTPTPGRHLFVDVVLIDKSNEILQPLLYQLKNEAMHSERELEQFRRDGYMSLDHNAFAMIGDGLPTIQQPGQGGTVKGGALSQILGRDLVLFQ